MSLIWPVCGRGVSLADSVGDAMISSRVAVADALPLEASESAPNSARVKTIVMLDAAITESRLRFMRRLTPRDAAGLPTTDHKNTPYKALP